MAFNLKLSGSNDAAGQTASDTTIMDDAQPIATKKSASGPGFLGQYSVIKQLQILGGALSRQPRIGFQQYLHCDRR